MNIVRDNGVRDIKDGLGRSVILLQQDHLGVLEMCLEIENVPNIRLPESIDTLRIVTHDTDVLLLLGEIADQCELQRVGVLVLIDEDVLELLVVSVAGLLRYTKELDGLDQQIIKVESVRGI